MRLFLLSHDTENGVYHLSSKERRYLFSVLRMSVNDVFTATDKDGNYYKAFLFSDDAMTVERTEDPDATLNDGLSSFRGPFFPVTMFISLLKGKKNETEIRMLTEMGVARIVLMETEFTEGKWNEHMAERTEAIIREAVQQSGSRKPELYGPVSFSQALSMAEETVLILHQSARGKTESLPEALKSVQEHVSCFIGPEGGFSDEECSEAESHGAIPVLLKTNILRAETAAVYTASALQTILHDRV